MANTMVISCSCDHEFQNNEYGNGKRLANLNEKAGKANCTVCGKQHIYKTPSTK
jgi:hypothetical protein